MLLTARALKAGGCTVHCICGFRDEPFFTGELKAAADGFAFTTESGCAGTKGLVTGILEPGEYDAVYCCGPVAMMKAVTEVCIRAGTPVYVSLETKMACGIGGCLVCACAGKQGKNYRVCKDGPVFRGEDVDYDA